MKKIICLLLALSLAALLTGCSRSQSTGAEPTANAPGYTIVEEPTAEAMPEVVDAPANTQPPSDSNVPSAGSDTVKSLSASEYTFEMLTDTSMGFVYAHPTEWVNLPGKSTVCYREAVEADDFPARVAVTKKEFAHTPKSSAVLKEFQSYAHIIYKQYDSSTFEFGDLNSDASFMGQSAYEITYLAYSGNIEVKGYMISCAIGHTMYVFHFCAAYDDYQQLQSAMTRMRDSVAVAD